MLLQIPLAYIAAARMLGWRICLVVFIGSVFGATPLLAGVTSLEEPDIKNAWAGETHSQTLDALGSEPVGLAETEMYSLMNVIIAIRSAACCINKHRISCRCISCWSTCLAAHEQHLLPDANAMGSMEGI